MKKFSAIIVTGLLSAMMLTGCASFGEDMLNKIVDSDAMQGMTDAMASLEQSMSGYTEEEKQKIFDSMLKQETIKQEASAQAQASSGEGTGKVTTKSEACKAYIDFLASLEDSTPKDVLDEFVTEKAGGVLPLDMDTYRATMQVMTMAEWKKYFIKLDNSCKETSTAIKSLIPNVVKLLQQP